MYFVKLSIIRQKIKIVLYFKLSINRNGLKKTMYKEFKVKIRRLC